ncbi:hypothetical protein ACJ41O_015153 [Fusarium nematophilum]
MRLRYSFALGIHWVAAAQAAVLPGIPTAFFDPNSQGSDFSFSKLSAIVVDTAFADARDERGQTLIPPSLADFARTFATDLEEVFALNITVRLGSRPEPGAIFVTLDAPKGYLDVAGRETPEGYSIEIDDLAIIKGPSPLGVWWGTRTLLQQMLLSDDGVLHAGHVHDSPGWGQRGMMLDAARHFYAPEFLVELCSYMSFFKQNILHLHLNDNLWNNPDLFDFDAQMEVFAAFRLLSDDPRVEGLNNRHNESYTRAAFDSIQEKCAARGVTILPEFDAPGHSLVFSQWKPEIGMSTDYTLLNLSHPETTPSLKTVWEVFLPWFHTKTVSIGADEYRDASLSPNALVAQYENYVNELSGFIAEASGKQVRIWGTFPPRSGSHVDKSVAIQHWANFEAYAKSDWLANGYKVMNSGDGIYVVSKWSSLYPQQLNQTFIFSGSPDGSPFAPNIFDPQNDTEKVVRENPYIEGHIAPIWTDWGPNSTTALETYYSWRDGLPALADKQWGGRLAAGEYLSLFARLQPAVPAQNLDRRVPSKGSTIFEYDFSRPELNGSSVHGTRQRPLAGYEAASNVTLVVDGALYTLNYTFPVDVWTNASLIGEGSRTYLDVGDGNGRMEFLTKMGIRGRRFVWGSMAVEAPLNIVGGGGFDGIIGHMKLEDDNM